jgi:uncharacterized phage protein gp47/JayE
MSLQAPKISEIEQNFLSQIGGKLSQTVPALAKGAINVMARVFAGVYTTQFKYGGFNLLQQFVQYATYSDTTILGKVIKPLREHGALYGIPDPAPGSRARLTVAIPVVNQVGSIPNGTQLIRLDTGVIYATVGATALNAATVNATIEAVQDPLNGNGYGAVGNLSVGDQLEFMSPSANYRRTNIPVATVVVQGDDPETEDEYRQKILDRKQKPPQGGSHADYYHWALTVPGIVDAFPYADLPGQVRVFVEASEASSGSPDGIPTGPQLTAVAAAIQFDDAGLASRRPIGAGVTVVPIVRSEFDFTVAGLQVTDQGAVSAAIEDGIDEFLRSRSPYIVGLSIPPRADIISQSEVSGLVFSIVQANNGSLVSVTMNQDGNPVPFYYLQMGEKAKCGLVSYI